MLNSFFTKYVDWIRYADSIAMAFDRLLIPTKHPIDSHLVLTSKGLLTITSTNPQVSTYKTIKKHINQVIVGCTPTNVPLWEIPRGYNKYHRYGTPILVPWINGQCGHFWSLPAVLESCFCRGWKSVFRKRNVWPWKGTFLRKELHETWHGSWGVLKDMVSFTVSLQCPCNSTYHVIICHAYMLGSCVWVFWISQFE